METILRILLTLVCLGIVVVIHEWGHFLVARRVGVRVERFTVGFGPEIFGWTRGPTRYALCAIPLGGMVKLAGEFLEERSNLPAGQAGAPDEFFSQPWYRRIQIALAGPLMNYLLAFVLFCFVAGVWGLMRPSSEPVIGEILPNLPAAAAGLKLSDRILSIDGKAVSTWEEMANIIHARPDQKVRLRIAREGEGISKPLSITLTPQKDPQRGLGLIGIMPKIEKVRVGFLESVKTGARDVRLWSLSPLRYLGQKVRKLESPKELSGPIGITQMLARAAREGFGYVLYLIAVISTGLGLFNLFPIPILDGGHILLYTWEGVSRRPLSKRVVQVANAVGLSIIVFIFLYASYQDIERWRAGFWK